MAKLGYLDGEPFIARMEHALERGDSDYADANIDRLRRLVAAYQDSQVALAQLQFRARSVLESYEPPAADRTGQPS